MAKKTLVLVILDGWGLGHEDNANPIYVNNPQNIDYLRHHFPAGSLQASGIAVGLPWGEEGNSEVGHLTLGSGKVIYQHFPRISLAVKDGSFLKNRVLLSAFEYAKKNNSAVNLIGLLTEGNVHASLDHLKALIKLSLEEGAPKLNLHIITDGKDGPPQGALDLIKELGNVWITSLSGRYFGMDRDLHLDRTEKAYRAMVGQTPNQGFKNPEELLNAYYGRDLTDEAIEPTLFLEDGQVKANDAVIFFNFREDSMRELAKMFIDSPIKNLKIVTLTRYSDTFNVPVAFPSEEIVNPLGKVLSDNGKIQLRLAETEKYAHVTYFFNGFREPPFLNEYRVLIPSKNVTRHDEFPEMMAKEITRRATSALQEGAYDFILINYANADIIAHTGNFEAALKAVETLDKEIGELMKLVLKTNAIMIITSDHGNIERMLNVQTGLPETKHDPSPVPIYLVGQDYETSKSDTEAESREKENVGVLADVAPTILEIMGLPIPAEMTGLSLLKSLK